MRAITIPAIGLLAILATSHAASAQTRATVIPSVSMGAVYDDNVSARAEGDAGRMLALRPSIEADLETRRVTLISLWSFDMQRSNHGALNTLDARRHGMLDAKLRSSMFTTWALAGRYDHTSTPGEIDFDSGILTDRRNAERWQLTPSVARRFGEKTTVTALYDWTTEDITDEFPGTFAGAVANGDRMTLHVARTSVSRLLSERTSLSTGYIGRLFDDPSSEEQSHTMLFGWTRELGQFTALTLQAGPRWTTYRGMQPEVAISLGRDGHRIKTGFDYSHGETIILGVPGPVQIDTGSARLTVVSSRTLEFGIRGGASQIITIDERAATVYRGSLVGSWSVGGPFTLTGSYSADYQLGDIRRNLFRDDKVLRHVVRVGVTVAPSFSRSFLPPEEAARAKGVIR